MNDRAQLQRLKAALAALNQLKVTLDATTAALAEAKAKHDRAQRALTELTEPVNRNSVSLTYRPKRPI